MMKNAKIHRASIPPWELHLPFIDLELIRKFQEKQKILKLELQQNSISIN